ncbi:MAG TPA: adenylate/guanylate cyclase domain-containing protein [Anaerolineales bacterium]|nr:adenylate/guanylate cyclase domain-containing protein [Anaerolineales bacterium]
MADLPSGTVTFLFTDIEGSTRLWQEQPEAMTVAHAQHDEILREAIEANNGFIFRIVGDSFNAAFHHTLDALRAVLTAQRRLHAESWDEKAVIKVRMGLHTGTAELITDGSNKIYSGYVTLASTQRVMSVAHGRQVLISQTTHDLLQNDLPENVSLRDMGEHRLKGLRAPLRLYQLSAPDLAQNFPVIQSPDALPNNLPVQLTSFVGREKEIAEIRDKLGSARLVTLTGSGGTGKTRLSIEVGGEELASFANGVWLVELAPLAETAQIIPAIAQTFGLQEHPFGPLPTLVMDYLRDKKILLILDNCEHLIQACARLADDLLHQCAGLKILASSREALGIAGELVYHTPSLADSESTHLFVDRARSVNPNFRSTESNTSAIAQICSRLDGIPLAIELAAARTKLLTPEQIAARLDDRFRLLVGGSRTALPRQQTLRALIDWSYDLLSDEEKRLLQFASVFVGGWTFDALEAVSDDSNVLEHLEGLVNKSLVTAEEHEIEMRYFMFETIRQYAREKLFEAKQSSAARDRHFVYFDNLSQKMWDVFRSQDMFDWRKKADDEVENFRAAVEWGLENHIEDALHLASHFCIMCSWLSKHSEGLALVKVALERLQSLTPVDGEALIRRQKIIANALFAQGTVAFGTGNVPLVMQSLKEAIAISRLTGDRLMLGYSLEMFVSASTFAVDAEGTEEAAQEGFKIFTQEINDRWGMSLAYQNLAWLANKKGDLIAKEKYFVKIRQLLRDIPFSFQAGLFYLGMGMMESIQGNYDTAKQLFEDGLEIFRRLQNKYFQTALRSELGHVARHSGDIHQAKKIYYETLREWKDLGNRAAIAHQLECFAFLAIADEEPQRAIKLFGAAQALRERVQASMTEPERLEYNQAMPRLHSMLAETEFTFLWTEGRAMTMEQAIGFALEESND